MTKISAEYRIHQILLPASDNVFLTVSEIGSITGLSGATIRRILNSGAQFYPRWNESYTRKIGWALSDSAAYHPWTNRGVAMAAQAAIKSA